MSESSKLRNAVIRSNIPLADIARRAGIALTTLHTFVNKKGSEMRVSNFNKVSAALEALRAEPSTRSRRGVQEDRARFDEGRLMKVEVPISAEQYKLLFEQSIDIEAIARAGAEKALKEAEARAWAEANREAIEASNRWIEKHGTLAEQLGLI